LDRPPLKLTSPRADISRMDNLLISTFVFFGILLVGALWMAKVYNKLVRLRNRADALWADIDVQLKRRHDLVPNLVQAASSYATHERSTLDEVTRARNQAMLATSPTDKTHAENMLTASLGRLFADAEQYPNLKAEGDFSRLENELQEIESTIAMSRQSYNLTVQAYNNVVDTYPSAIAAWFSGFEERPYLTVEESDRAVPSAAVPTPAPSS
jgi:LemA protein